MKAIADLPARLRGILGSRGVIEDRDALEPFVTDWRRVFTGQPACVVQPASIDEVVAAVQACREWGVPIVPQGGNTGLAGGAVPDRSGNQVVLSLTRMAGIREIDPVGMTLVAEAGCVLKVAQDAAAAENRLLPISLAAEGSATIGGIVASNAGGVNVLRYGMTRNLVLGLEVVLSDGTVLSGLRSLRKDNAGYDLKQLFIGSEGTLGIVTAAVLRLLPKPKHSITALLAVPDPPAALALLKLAQDEIGDTISAFELISGASLRLVEKHAKLRPPIKDGEWFVLIEAASSLADIRQATENVLGTALEREVALDGVVAESTTQAAQLWALREHVTECEAREGRSVKHDVSVPIPALPGFLQDAGRAVASAIPDARINVFGHLGDGNIHYNVLVDAQQETSALNRIVHDLVALYGGSISAEHGIGQYRRSELLRYRDPAEMELAARLKLALDPDGFLNPGKVLAPPPSPPADPDAAPSTA